MTTQEIANKLVEMCNAGQWQQAQDELYADDVVSIEAEGVPNNRVEGFDNVRAKGNQWADNVEAMHSAEMSAPIVSGNHFAITHNIDATFKDSGRQTFSEVSVYQVRDGKIVKEQFFYDMG